MNIVEKVQILAGHIENMTSLIGIKPDYVIMSVPDYHAYLQELSDEDTQVDTGHGTVEIMRIPVVTVGFNIIPSVVYEPMRLPVKQEQL